MKQTSDQSLRVAINAQLRPHGGSGGAETVLIGLISALGKLTDSPEEYIIITHSAHTEWLKPFTGPNQTVVPFRTLAVQPRGPLYNLLRTVVRKGRRMAKRLLDIRSDRVWPEVALSDGFYEGLGCDVIHFPFQDYLLCSIPSIYNPHDLQHLHYPQYFRPIDIAWRETVYPAACHLSHTIVAASQWVKQDIIRHYHEDPDKIQVIPWAPPTMAHDAPAQEMLESVQKKYSLSHTFAFYPAMTWPHKNHMRLLDAMRLLRDKEGLRINLVCTGHKNDHWGKIEEHIIRLNLQEQVKFLGMVSAQELRAIYALSQFVIVPTLFEAASGPVFEAWHEGKPVACSTVTSLPEQVGDAALLFDPLSVDAIVDAMRRLSADGALREQLMKRGTVRLNDFSWERTAKAYRAVYRRAGGRELTDEDRRLLAWDWMRNPNGERMEKR